MFNFLKHKNGKHKGSDIEIPVQFYTNTNGETCFRETVAGEYKIDRAGNVVRYR